MRADLLLSIKMLLFASSVHTETPGEPDLQFSGPRARMASREGISVHEQYLPTVEMGLNLRILGQMLTSFSRLVSGHEVINSIIVPCSIH